MHWESPVSESVTNAIRNEELCGRARRKYHLEVNVRLDRSKGLFAKKSGGE